MGPISFICCSRKAYYGLGHNHSMSYYLSIFLLVSSFLFSDPSLASPTVQSPAASMMVEKPLAGSFKEELSRSKKTPKLFALFVCDFFFGKSTT